MNLKKHNKKRDKLQLGKASKIKVNIIPAEREPARSKAKTKFDSSLNFNNVPILTEPVYEITVRRKGVLTCSGETKSTQSPNHQECKRKNTFVPPCCRAIKKKNKYKSKYRDVFIEETFNTRTEKSTFKVRSNKKFPGQCAAVSVKKSDSPDKADVKHEERSVMRDFATSPLPWHSNDVLTDTYPNTSFSFVESVCTNGSLSHFAGARPNSSFHSSVTNKKDSASNCTVGVDNGKTFDWLSIFNDSFLG